MLPTISLLHATHHRHGGPLPVRDAWLAAADAPQAVEHVFAMDGDDERAVADTDGLLRAVGEPTPGVVTAVRNWNAAAALATGDVLMVVADDLFPTPGWDSTLRHVVAGLDPRVIPYAIQVADGEPSNCAGTAKGATDGSAEATGVAGTARGGDRDRRLLLRHPVVTRAYYRDHGLFDSDFRGVYCDDDITRTAFWKAAILDGTAVRIEHRHPVDDRSKSFSVSQRRINTPEEYAHGKLVYRGKWNRLQRGVPPRTVAANGVRDRVALDQVARNARRDATLDHLRHTARRRTRRIVSGSALVAADRFRRIRRAIRP